MHRLWIYWDISGSHGDIGDVQRTPALWGRLHLPAEEARGGGHKPQGRRLKAARCTLSQNSVVSHTSSKRSVKDGTEQLPAEPVQTVVEESRSEGTIGVSLYVKYLKAGANILVLIGVVLLQFLAQAAYILQDWWLAYWAGEAQR
ncbi:ATP-binding cassette sub-family C member 4-like [Salvelinus alpinus]